MSVIEQDEVRSPVDQLKQCRICLDSDNLNELISPCLCSGSSAYVHRQCLNAWRSENANGKGFKFCDICQFEYVIQTVITNPQLERERLLKYHFFVFRDITLIILLIQSIIVGLAFLLKIIDRNSHNIKNLFPNSINGFIVYYLSAFILLLALLGLFVLLIFCFAIGGINSNTGGLTSRSRSSTSGSSASIWFAGITIIVLIFAFIGFFVGIILSVVIFKKIMKHHTEKLWLRQEADKYIVKDFHGQRNELEKYKKNLPVQLLPV